MSDNFEDDDNFEINDPEEETDECLTPTEAQVFNTNEFKRLQRLWYALIKEDGFKDIEDLYDKNGDIKKDPPLATWHNFKFKQTPIVQRMATESYYDNAKALLQSYKFKNELERQIWDMHSQGLSKRKIEKILASSPKPVKRTWIGDIIQKIAKEIKE